MRKGRNRHGFTVIDDEEDDFLLCSKCVQMSNLTSTYDHQDSMLGVFSDILLNRKNIDHFLPGDYICSESMSTSRKLIGLPPHDFRMYASYEFSLFEHVVLYKFWYKLLE